MAKKKASPKAAKAAQEPKRKGLDLPDDWEVVEEDVPKKKQKKEPQISNNMLWLLFIAIFVAFIAIAFWANSAPKEMKTTQINGIPVSAPGDPLIALRALAGKHIVGKTINNLTAETNALQEIGAVIGQSRVATYGGEHTLFTGITDRTGIFIDDKTTHIEGSSTAGLWKAVWAFTSTISNTEVSSSIDLYEVQQITAGRDTVYLVQDATESGCQSSYGRIISAEGDILSSLGYKQSQFGFGLKRYTRNESGCFTYAGNATFANVTCPSADSRNLVITLAGARSNRITLDSDSINLDYASCETVDRISVILRDLLHPNIVSDMLDVELPKQ